MYHLHVTTQPIAQVKALSTKPKVRWCTFIRRGYGFKCYKQVSFYMCVSLNIMPFYCVCLCVENVIIPN